MYKIVKLNFTAPLHLGKEGIGLEECSIFAHSDTIYSAFCNAWSQIYGSDSLDNEMIYPYLKGEFPFTISSAFPFYEDIYFLPKPMLRYNGIDDLDNREDLLKLIKKTDFIPLQFFIDWVSGTKATAKEYTYLQDYKNNILEKSYYRYDTSRVQIDRLNSKGVPFHCGLVRYAENAGLYLIIHIENEEIVHKIKQTFEYLGEIGLGGQLSNGCGKFSAKWLSLNDSFQELFQPDFEADAYCTLSLYNPGEKEIENIISGASYDLLMRRGWAYSRALNKSYRRKNCRMFKEGSVFSNKTKGRILDITPDNYNLAHKIYRFGISLDVPVKRGDNNDI